MFAWLSDPALVVASAMSLLAVITVVALALTLSPRDRPEARLAKLADTRERLFERMKRERGRERSVRDDIMRFSNWQEWMTRMRLRRLIEQPGMREKLVQAGWRSPRHAMIFTMSRLIAPPALALLSVLYIGLNPKFAPPAGGLVLVAIIGGLIGFFMPSLLVKNAITKRRKSLMRQFPDALDLILICVEAGQSLEAAMNRVTEDMGRESPEIAEECGLTAAEFAFMSDRATALENLAKRTDLPSIRALCMALIQAERYGTPVAQSLRVAALEGRDQRMAQAEEKAAALPPKLTVPMILFFLPILFAIMIGPTIIQVMDQFGK